MAAQVSTVQGSDTTVSTDATLAEMPRKTISLTTLFEDYDYCDAAVQEAERAVETAKRARSKCVQQILVSTNGKKKIRRNGKELLIVERVNKTTGETTAFLRGKGENPEDYIEV